MAIATLGSKTHDEIKQLYLLANLILIMFSPPKGGYANIIIFSL